MNQSVTFGPAQPGECHEMTFVINWRSTNKDIMSQLLQVTDLLHVFVGHRPVFYDKNHQIIETM